MIDPADPNPELARGLMLVHGNHAEALRELMIAWIRRHPLAPLETETILVQSNGIAQWLKRWLARAPDAADDPGCGIAAGLDFSLPSRFLWQVYRAVLGPGAVPEVSPFDKPRLMWRLMRMLPSLVAEPVHAPLARFLADDGDLRKRFQLAERLADLFDQYQVYRADWLAAWAAGRGGWTCSIARSANGCRACWLGRRCSWMTTAARAPSRHAPIWPRSTTWSTAPWQPPS